VGIVLDVVAGFRGRGLVVMADAEKVMGADFSGVHCMAKSGLRRCS